LECWGESDALTARKKLRKRTFRDGQILYKFC
jgi:hypothetical protein